MEWKSRSKESVTRDKRYASNKQQLSSRLETTRSEVESQKWVEAEVSVRQ